MFSGPRVRFVLDHSQCPLRPILPLDLGVGGAGNPGPVLSRAPRSHAQLNYVPQSLKRCSFTH